MENPGIDPGTSRMRIERSTIWANSPPSLHEYHLSKYKVLPNNILKIMLCNFLTHQNFGTFYGIFEN